MICIYAQDCTDFSNNGMGMLMPQSCTVTETLNGEYELTLIHPYDDTGKWRKLVTDRIIRVPVPASMTPKINMTVRQSRQTTQTVTEQIYRVTTNTNPLRLRSGPSTDYSIISKYAKGTEVTVLAQTTSSWYECLCPDGCRGYMSAGYLTYVRTETKTVVTEKGVDVLSTVEPRQMRDQPFRIYRVVPELGKVTVYARHLFYDLMDNMIDNYAPDAETTGASVLQGISSHCLTSHKYTFYSDLTGTAEEVTFENVNPVDAILDGDGLIDKYGGELVRDWWDVYVVNRVGTDAGVTIREGKNLTGITYDEDETDVVTRIMPTGEDADGNVMYLPEKYIDSDYIDNYPHPKWYHMAVSEAKVQDGDEPRTAEECYTLMREEVQKQYDGGCDIPTITLKVNFVNVTDTEDYAQYKFLQNIFIGDTVSVIVKRLGIAVAMRMTQYTYDCLTRKYTSMTLGSAEEALDGNTISSRQLSSGSVTSGKIAPNAVGSLQIKADSILAGHIDAEAVTTEKLAAGTVTTQKLAAGSVTAEKIAAGAIDAQTISAMTAKIQTLTAQSITTDDLAAAMAAFQVIVCGTASFDAATVRHLVSEALNVTNSTSGDAFISNLRVAYAQMVSATIGDLCIKASDGNYYLIDVNSNGTVTATQTTVTAQEIAQGHTNAGDVIVASDITAASLSTSDIFATYALVNKIDAARIDVDQLYARQAFIDKLKTSNISSDSSVTITVSDLVTRTGDATAAAAAAQSTANGAASAASAAQTTANNAAGAAATAQTTANNAASAASAAQGTANSAVTAAGTAQSTADGAATAASNAQNTANSASSAASAAQGTANSAVSAAGTAQSTANTAQSAATSAQTTADAAMTKVEFNRLVRIDTAGLHVGDNQTQCETLIDSDSFNVVINGVRYSKFAANYAQFGSYQMRETADGGIAFVFV